MRLAHGRFVKDCDDANPPGRFFGCSSIYVSWEVSVPQTSPDQVARRDTSDWGRAGNGGLYSQLSAVGYELSAKATAERVYIPHLRIDPFGFAQGWGTRFSATANGPGFQPSRSSLTGNLGLRPRLV